MLCGESRQREEMRRTGRCAGWGDGNNSGMWAAKEKKKEAEKAWSRTNEGGMEQMPDEDTLFGPVYSCVLSCLFTRRAAQRAFASHGRSTGASHLVEEMENVIEEWEPVKRKL